MQSLLLVTRAPIPALPAFFEPLSRPLPTHTLSSARVDFYSLVPSLPHTFRAQYCYADGDQGTERLSKKRDRNSQPRTSPSRDCPRLLRHCAPFCARPHPMDQPPLRNHQCIQQAAQSHQWVLVLFCRKTSGPHTHGNPSSPACARSILKYQASPPHPFPVPLPGGPGLHLLAFCFLCRNTVPLCWQSCACHLTIRMLIGQNLGPSDPSSAPMLSRPGPRPLSRLSRSTGPL